MARENTENTGTGPILVAWTIQTLAYFSIIGPLQFSPCVFSLRFYGEPFDYTRWQRTLWFDKNIEEISQAAIKYRRAEVRK